MLVTIYLCYSSTCFVINHESKSSKTCLFWNSFSWDTLYIDSCVDLRICKRNPHGQVLRWNSYVSFLFFSFLSLSSSIRFWFTYRFIELQVLFYLRVSHLLFSFPSPVFGFSATSTLIFAARDERMQILHYKRGFKGSMVLFYFTPSIDLVVNLNIYFIYLRKKQMRDIIFHEGKFCKINRNSVLIIRL